MQVSTNPLISTVIFNLPINLLATGRGAARGDRAQRHCDTPAGVGAPVAEAVAIAMPRVAAMSSGMTRWRNPDRAAVALDAPHLQHGPTRRPLRPRGISLPKSSRPRRPGVADDPPGDGVANRYVIRDVLEGHRRRDCAGGRHADIKVRLRLPNTYTSAVAPVGPCYP
jgi:hypothetical protein